MVWQHQDVGITTTNANSVPKKDPIRIDYKDIKTNSMNISTKYTKPKRN